MIEAIDAVNGNPVVQPPPPKIPPPTPGANDGVALSETAQANLLNQQGLSVAEIAAQLDLSAQEVQNDLGIAASITQADATAAQPVQAGATATVSQTP